ncbi:MAG: type II toxin-antitoxin system RelE/ParE family toxin [Candidatus Marinimicrobia bacterium]|jgi:mRNA interferase RelE/StbE|nr:type II toxin-antitoxin system RelE/ParE family toxin [Candidatus Neomarinimicrobiota bacterium]MBT3631874.1 type II toxin-antitoxin system RelE/ParE family toxin [Candidatus Neomarinimicrobiota bacterium]MBT3824433.1 type II toxin-antitoxin system RelE/ParE family toxin [Candidatus Neomarinimicrobiota bacterium]MBT4131113.1 type II toxin-antitoxin system RelE/ParE family toxin [Candidatus Neomarinimicrobiota bacterium]MBT4295725.1 type II toxin-antitoxin system RelE/ParE family toxin [Candi
MVFYKIEFKKSVKKDLRHLPRKNVVKILDRICDLASDSRPRQSTKLSRQEKYRLRYGKYRILYEIRDQLLLITIVKVGHRKNIYH